MLKFINVDVKFKQGLIGKSKDEIIKIFPKLKEKEFSNDHQKSYLNVWSIQNKDFLWIGESAWIIIFEDGKLKHFIILKG
jgi:hypothetical protein